MKKAFLVVAVASFLVAISFSSCKSSEDCPAYSKANVETNSVNA